MANDPTTKSFSPDPNIQKIAEAYAIDAVAYSNTQFGIQLDWSESSISEVEKALVLMHASYIETNPKPTEEQVMTFAKMYGSYIGEVYRRNHGAEWGLVYIGGQRFPGLQTKSGTNFWPWGRALNRVMQGAENNVKDYYDALLKR